MDKPEPKFTLEELLAQLCVEDGDGWTIRELCGKAGWAETPSNLRKVRAWKDEQVALGRMEHIGDKRVYYDTIRGDKIVPCYRVRE